MHPEKIKYELKLQGLTQSKIAAELNVTPQTVRGVIHGHTQSARIQKLIAQKIGKQVSDIWTPPVKINRTADEMRQSA